MHDITTVPSYRDTIRKTMRELPDVTFARNVDTAQSGIGC